MSDRQKAASLGEIPAGCGDLDGVPAATLQLLQPVFQAVGDAAEVVRRNEDARWRQGPAKIGSLHPAGRPHIDVAPTATGADSLRKDGQFGLRRAREVAAAAATSAGSNDGVQAPLAAKPSEQLSPLRRAAEIIEPQFDGLRSSSPANGASEIGAPLLVRSLRL